MNRLQKLVLSAAGIATVSVLVVASAQARYLAAPFSGNPDPISESNCWMVNGVQLMLHPACSDSNNHFFQISLPMDDTATWVNAERYQACSGGTCVGQVCSRGVTYNQDGTFYT